MQVFAAITIFHLSICAISGTRYLDINANYFPNPQNFDRTLVLLNINNMRKECGGQILSFVSERILALAQPQHSQTFAVTDLCPAQSCACVCTIQELEEMIGGRCRPSNFLFPHQHHEIG